MWAVRGAWGLEGPEPRVCGAHVGAFASPGLAGRFHSLCPAGSGPRQLRGGCAPQAARIPSRTRTRAFLPSRPENRRSSDRPGVCTRSRGLTAPSPRGSEPVVSGTDCRGSAHATPEPQADGVGRAADGRLLPGPGCRLRTRVTLRKETAGRCGAHGIAPHRVLPGPHPCRLPRWTSRGLMARLSVGAQQGRSTRHLGPPSLGSSQRKG